MKQPMALLGGAALAAAAAAALGGPVWAGLLAAGTAGLGLCALLAALLGRKKKKLSSPPGRRAFLVLGWGAAALFTMAAVLGGYLLRWQVAVAPALALEGETVTLTGTVVDYPEEQYHRTYYRVQVEEITRPGEEPEKLSFTARLSTVQPLVCQPEDRVQGSVTFTAYDRDGTLFSQANDALAEGLVLRGYFAAGETVRVQERLEPSLRRLAAVVRRQVGRSFDRLLPAREAGLLRGMLLAQRDRIQEADEEAFRQVGASHLLVVSGLHLTAIAGLLMLLVRRLAWRQGLRELLVLAGVWGYLGLIGAPVSALRAGIMFTLMMASRSLTRSPAGVNSLGAAVWGMVLVNPFLGGDVGFWLSVAATLGLVLFFAPVSRGLDRLLERAPGIRRAAAFPLQLVAMTLCVQAVTFPLQMLVFGSLSLLAPLAGLLMAVPCTVLLYLAALGAAAGLAPFLAGVQEALVWCAGVLARGVADLAQALARWTGFTLDLTDRLTLIAVGVVLLLLALAVFRRRRPRARRVLGALALLVTVTAWGVSHAARAQTVTLAVLPESTCVVAFQGDRAAVLSLGGYRTGAAARLLARKNVSQVEMLCLPLRDQDAREAALAVLERFPVERTALPQGGYVGKDLARALGEEPLFLREGESFSLLEDVRVTARGEMTRLEVEIYGNLVVLETGESLGGSTSLLLTDCRPTRVISPLSVVMNRDIMETASEDLPQGAVWAPGEAEAWLRFTRDGAVSIEGETHG